MANLYREPRTCPDCGYTTDYRVNYCRHRKSCKNRPTEPDVEKDQLRERVQALEQQLATKDEQLATKDEQLATKDEQLATKDEHYQAELKAKDKQIDELIRLAKKPRTVNNTNNNQYQVNQQINVFGKESLAHLTEAKLQELLSDPHTSVARLVTLKHSVEENQNVRVPNSREKWVQVLKEGADGKKVWESVPKNDLLSEIVETNAMLLEGEADESTIPGARYSRWHDQLRDSQEHNGRMFRDQMDIVHKTLVESTRQK